MSTKLIQIGENKYVNPAHIIVVIKRNQDNWMVRMKDGGEFVIEIGYFDDFIREVT